MHKAAVPALGRTSVPRLTGRAGCHTSRAFVILLVQVTVFVPICPVTICFLSFWAAAQEQRLWQSLHKVLLSVS